MATEAQILANQKNAQLSTGPTSATGKDRSSHNAVKTALTGHTVLLPSDDVEAYKSHIARLHDQLKPLNDDERVLVQSVADTEWRLLRIPSLDANIRALGRVKLADLHANQSDPATRAAFIEAEVQLTYRKDLSNLALQETRLRRHRQVDTEKLEALQAARKEAEKKSKNMNLASQLYANAVSLGNTFIPELFGFEFSNAEIQRHRDLEDFKANMIGRENKMSQADYSNAAARFTPLHQRKTAA